MCALVTGVQTCALPIYSCPARTKAVLHMLDGVTGAEVAQKTLSIPGHGVGKIELPSTEIPDFHQMLAFEYEFDRRVSHQKPIVFRHHNHGVINCNHS